MAPGTLMDICQPCACLISPSALSKRQRGCFSWSEHMGSERALSQYRQCNVVPILNPPFSQGLGQLTPLSIAPVGEPECAVVFVFFSVCDGCRQLIQSYPQTLPTPHTHSPTGSCLWISPLPDQERSGPGPNLELDLRSCQC